MAYTPRLEKIKNLMVLVEETDEEYEFCIDAIQRGSDDLGREAYQIEQKRKRLKQKLRKQMAKYLEETNDA